MPIKYSTSRKAQFTARQLEERCVTMRNRGLNSIEISKELGVTAARVSRACSRALSRVSALSDYQAEEMRRLELSRLDEMHAAIYAKAIGDEYRLIETPEGEKIVVKSMDLRAIETVLKIQQARLKYIPGLEVPKIDEGKSNTPVQIQVNYVNQGVDGKAVDAPPPVVVVNQNKELMCPEVLDND